MVRGADGTTIVGHPAHGINRGFLHYALSEILKQSTLGANSRWNLLPWQTLRPEALKLGLDFHGSYLPSKELH